MHLLSTRPGGYVDDGGQGVVRVAQTPGDIVILSAADTTLSLLSEAAARLPAGGPRIRLANQWRLRQPASAVSNCQWPSRKTRSSAHAPVTSAANMS